MARTTQPATRPDGIREEQERSRSGWRRHASPASLVVFGAVIVLGLTGVLGHERDWRAEAEGTEMVVHAPETIRNGEFLEMRIHVEADQPIGELAVGIDAALLEDLTVNTMIPAPTDETSLDGEFRFTFAELEAGTSFLLKVDLQINPDIVGANEGAVAIYDGTERLVDATIRITVLP